jgi:hypothetical protein
LLGTLTIFQFPHLTAKVPMISEAEIVFSHISVGVYHAREEASVLICFCDFLVSFEGN